VGGDPDQVHPATLKLNNEQHIQPGQAHRLHGQEITREHPAGLRPQERRPARPATPGRRTEAVTPQDPAHRRGRHPHAELAALPYDPHVPPPRVLLRHPHHQVDDLGGQPLMSSTGTSAGPATRHQLPMPPQQRRGCNEKDRPAFPWQQPRQYRQHHSVGGCVLRPDDLAPHHHQLMAQYGNLYVLGVRRATQTSQAKNTPDDHERQRANDHDSQPATTVSPLVTALTLGWHPTPTSSSNPTIPRSIAAGWRCSHEYILPTSRGYGRTADSPSTFRPTVGTS
jgi:hypothetical protein